MTESGRTTNWIELVSTVLLSLATVATAWAGYQAARWHGEQAQAQTRATATRLESTRASGTANRQVTVDVSVFTQWVDAHERGERNLAAFYRSRFTPRFKPAFAAWIAKRPFEKETTAPPTPFDEPGYRLSAEIDARRLEATAAAASEEARRDIERANNYVLAVVLFAASLFFAGISTKLRTERGQAVVLGLGCLLFIGTVVWVATFPVSLAV